MWIGGIDCTRQRWWLLNSVFEIINQSLVAQQTPSPFMAPNEASPPPHNFLGQHFCLLMQPIRRYYRGRHPPYPIMPYLLRTCYRIRPLFLLAREKSKRENLRFTSLMPVASLRPLMTSASSSSKPWSLLSMSPPLRHSLISVYLQ